MMEPLNISGPLGDYRIEEMAMNGPVRVGGVCFSPERMFAVIKVETGEELSRWVIALRAIQEAQHLAGVPETPLLPRTADADPPD